LLQKFIIFLIKEKSQTMWSRQLFGNFEKNKNKKSHFEEKSFEIVKIFQKVWANCFLAFFF